MKHFLILFLLAMTTGLSAQFDAENVEYLGNFDDDTLPIHTFGTFNEVWGYALAGKEYAIMGSAAFIHIFDVTDPTQPMEIKRIDPQSQTVWRDFKSYKSYIYAVADSSPDGLTVIDFSIPEEASIILQNTEQFTSCHNIYIDEENGRLYTAGSGRGTFVYDLIEDPANPKFIGKAPLADFKLHDIYVRDNIAYGSAENDGYYIFDLTDVENEVLLASAETNGYNHSSWVSDDGTYAIFAEEVPTGLPLGIMELEDMENGNIEVNNYFKFPLLAPEEDGATPHNPFIIGDYAYVSYYQDGLVIFDLSDRSNPQRVGYFDTYMTNTAYPGYQGAWGCYPFLPSGNILISDMEFGLFTLNFTLDDEPTSSEELTLAKENLQLFPNPSNGLIQFRLPETVDAYQISLTNTAGQIIHQESTQRNGYQEQLDVVGLNSGIYFLQVRSENQLFQEKLIIE